MKQQCDRVAGLDVHRDTVVACLRLGRGDEPELHRKKFATTVAGVAALAAWMADFGVTRVVMESTGVYWKPVYYPLEGLFPELWLVNAGHVKNVPGSKTDIADAEWLADVAAHGMVRPSFVPPPPVRVLRELTRYRKTQIVIRAQEIQRLDKVLQDAGIKISSVASNVLGKSTRAMIEALIAGERDTSVLADMAKARMRSKIPALTEALVGRFAAHHGALARSILDHIDFLDAAIARLDEEVAARLGTFQGAVTLLETIPGVGRKVAETIVAETGADMTRFPSAAQLCAWAGVAPADHESAGKRRPAGTRQGASWLRRDSSRRPRRRAAPRTPTSAPSTGRSLRAVVRTRRPSPSRTRSCSRRGTCSATARPMTTWVPITCRPATATPRSTAWTSACKPWASMWR